MTSKRQQKYNIYSDLAYYQPLLNFIAVHLIFFGDIARVQTPHSTQ